MSKTKDRPYILPDYYSNQQDSMTNIMMLCCCYNTGLLYLSTENMSLLMNIPRNSKNIENRCLCCSLLMDMCLEDTPTDSIHCIGNLCKLEQECILFLTECNLKDNLSHIATDPIPSDILSDMMCTPPTKKYLECMFDIQLFHS